MILLTIAVIAAIGTLAWLKGQGIDIISGSGR